jgi:hypothetical protein
MFFFAKVAILILYYRAFKVKAWMRWSVYVLSVVMFFAYWMTGESTLGDTDMYSW